MCICVPDSTLGFVLALLQVAPALYRKMSARNVKIGLNPDSALGGNANPFPALVFPLALAAAAGEGGCVPAVLEKAAFRPVLCGMSTSRTRFSYFPCNALLSICHCLPYGLA